MKVDMSLNNETKPNQPFFMLKVQKGCGWVLTTLRKIVLNISSSLLMHKMKIISADLLMHMKLMKIISPKLLTLDNLNF